MPGCDPPCNKITGLANKPATVAKIAKFPHFVFCGPVLPCPFFGVRIAPPNSKVPIKYKRNAANNNRLLVSTRFSNFPPPHPIAPVCLSRMGLLRILPFFSVNKRRHAGCAEHPFQLPF